MAKEMTKSPSKKTTTKTTAAVEKPVVAERREFLPSDEISCVSVTAGELIMIGRKTGNVYTWSNYGDTAQVEYQDLKAEKFNSKSRYIYDPLFIIDDDDVLHSSEFKNVFESYQNILSAEDIEELFNLDNISFRKTLQGLPIGLQNSVRTIAAEKIQNGTFDSLSKIRTIDEILGTDLFNSYLGEE